MSLICEAVEPNCKTCGRCKVQKDITAFHLKRASKGGFQSFCRPCGNADFATWKARNPNHARRRLYGMADGVYDQMLSDQRGACAICSAVFTKPPHVDHDHSTGAIRGLLCHHCNVAIGHLQDNAGHCRAAATYLEVHSGITQH